MITQDLLLTTKLYIPRLGPNLVARPHLIARLNEGLARKLTIISAPAGFGKTTLLSEWVYQAAQGPAGKSLVQPARVGWLSLDEGDNDPVRFLSYVVAALQTIQPELGQASLAILGRQFGPSPEWSETAMTTLLNEIAPTDDPLILILDDFHAINAPSMQRLVAFLVEHLPPQMHLIISGRSDPKLPLARLRAQGQLLELRTADLRFSRAEAATFLNQVMQLALTAADIASLEARTEGWIAGLQLAALSMRDRHDVSAFIAGFSGSHRYIFDYLAEEVLNRQPVAIQTFLLHTAILNRLTGPLCDALIQGSEVEREISSSQTILEQLQQANLFILPLDDERRWYRYHHLFSEFLQSRLQNEASSSLLTRLHHQAAAWYEANGLAAEATGHALAMADVERAARLIELGGRSVLNRSEMSTLRSWLEALPEELVRVRPQLSLFHAWALVLTGQLDAVETRIQDAEQVLLESGRAAEIPGELTAIRGTLAYFRRDLPQAIALFRQALELLPADNLFLRGAVVMSLATACNLAGDLNQARRYFAQAIEIYEPHNRHLTLIAVWNLANLCTLQGELHQAAQVYRRGIDLAGDPLEQNGGSPLTGRLFIGLARLLYQWNDLAGIAEPLATGIKLGRQNGDPSTIISGYLLQAWLHQAQGDGPAALAVVQQAEIFGRQHNVPGWRVQLAAAKVRLLLKAGRLDEASHWANLAQAGLQTKGLDDSAGYHEELRQLSQLTQVRLLLAQKKPAAALTLLAPLRQSAEHSQRQGQLIEIMTLQALAYQSQAHLAQALTTLEEALLMAEPEQYVRLFVDEVGPTEALLRQVRARGLVTAYIDKLLAALAGPKTSRSAPVPLVDPLSERELEILHLIEAGLSNQQISDKLFLTVGTVKWHVNNIFTKLGVRRRTQALSRARELDLLE